MTVYRFFVNKVPAAADDLTQTTFEACLSAKDRIRGSSVRADLLGIARRKLLMYLRTQHRWSARFEFGDMSVEDMLDSPSAVVAEHEADRALLVALRRMSFDMQATLELYYWEELPLLEIAEILGVPEGTIKSRLARARDVLRDSLSDPSVPDSRAHTVDNLDAWARRLRAHFQSDSD